MQQSMQPIPSDAVVAMAYVPWQELQDVYEPEAALTFGTLFPELNKPFTAGGKRDG